MASVFLVLLIRPWEAAATGVTIGQPFPDYTFTDPQGRTLILKPETRFVVVASEKAVSDRMTPWLTARPPDFLSRHRAEYVADITPMPDLITTLFALPKMRKFPFPMLLADDPRFARLVPAQAGKLAVFVLDDQRRVSQLHYLAGPEELGALLTPDR